MTLSKSARRPTVKEYFVFFMPILAKYILIIYIVVSVEPCITDESLPMKLSGPYLAKISFSITRELDPDIGLNSASGNTSVGKLILLNSGFNRLHI